MENKSAQDYIAKEILTGDISVVNQMDQTYVKQAKLGGEVQIDTDLLIAINEAAQNIPPRKVREAISWT